MESTPVLETATLTSRERIAPGFWCLGFRSERIAQRARAAHYVAIDVPGPFSVRLPLGIWTVAGDTFTLLFKEWGDRTIRLSRVSEGTPISLIGPLGNVFDVTPRGSRATIISGGIGVVPFWLLARDLVKAGVHVTAVLGARTREHLVGLRELENTGIELVTCTDDGSLGRRGTVIDILATLPGADMLYGCGPPGMLRALCAYALEKGVPCRISMEETFGCSMGTCWGCVVPVRRGAAQAVGYPRAVAEKRAYDFARVCADGTVFDARDLVWPS